jgi:hypothetical protein
LILLIALAAGLVVGASIARIRKRPWRLPHLQHLWLVLVAFIPQWLAIYLPATRVRIPDSLAAASLSLSLVLLLLFCWFNRRLPGIWLLALGTGLNLAVILANGGFMPISLGAAGQLVPPEKRVLLEVGDRFGFKDVLLLPENTRLGWLSDHFLLPEWMPYRAAFSPGDLAIAAGVFWLTAWPEKPLNLIQDKEYQC